VSEHGSWNRDPLNGYEVVYVPFQNGCPVGVALDKTGALLIADDVGNVAWRVSAAGSAQAVSAR
jgi:glucose/arabinose dehydrogenase